MEAMQRTHHRALRWLRRRHKAHPVFSQTAKKERKERTEKSADFLRNTEHFQLQENISSRDK